MADSLAIVGAGPANVQLLTALANKVRTLENLSRESLPNKKIYLIDHEGNHGMGKPWGKHAHPSMLFSHTAGALKEGFLDWLKDNEALWLPQVEVHRTGALKTWFNVNQDNLDKKNYEDIRFPRFVYGLCMRDRLCQTLKDMPKCLDVVLLEGKVAHIEKRGEGNTLTFDNPAEEIALIKEGNGSIRLQHVNKHYKTIEVDANVIGTGSPERPAYEKVREHPDYFANHITLHPALEGHNFAEQFKQSVLTKFHQTGQKVNIGILGAAFSFLDIVNFIYNDDELRNAINLTSISSTGMARTEQEQKPGRPKYGAPESEIALKNLGVKFIAAKIEDVIPNLHGAGITIKTSDTHLDAPDAEYKPGTRSDKSEHVFDIVIQATGHGHWKNVGLLQDGASKNLFTEDAANKWLAIDDNLHMGGGNYGNGFIADHIIEKTLINRQQPAEGLLNNAHAHAPLLADTLSHTLFGKEIESTRAGLGHGSISKKPTITKFSELEQMKSVRSV